MDTGCYPEEAMQTAYIGAGQMNPKQMTRRDRLNFQRQSLQAQLDNVNKALAVLDAHPELEEFIETLARAGA